MKTRARIIKKSFKNVDNRTVGIMLLGYFAGLFVLSAVSIILN